MAIIAIAAGLGVISWALTGRMIIDQLALFFVPFMIGGVCLVAALPPATPSLALACIMAGFAIAMSSGFLYRCKTGWVLFAIAEILVVAGGLLNIA